MQKTRKYTASLVNQDRFRRVQSQWKRLLAPGMEGACHAAEVLSLAKNISSSVQKQLEFAASEPFPGLEAKMILLVWCIAGESAPEFITHVRECMTVQSPWCPRLILKGCC